MALRSTVRWDYIKQWSLATGSTTRILTGKGVHPDLIMTVESRSDGGGGFFFDSTARVRTRWVDAMVTGLGEPKLELRCMKGDEI
jgi:hypothetical protein